MPEHYLCQVALWCGFLVVSPRNSPVSNVMFGFRPRQMKRLKSAGYDFYSMPMLCGDLLIFCPERLCRFAAVRGLNLFVMTD